MVSTFSAPWNSGPVGAVNCLMHALALSPGTSAPKAAATALERICTLCRSLLWACCLPGRYVRATDCPVPPAGCSRGASLCSSGTCSVCEESRGWGGCPAGSLHRRCLWADGAREHLQAPRPVQTLLQSCGAWAGEESGGGGWRTPRREMAVHCLTTGLRPGGRGRVYPVFSRGCLLGPGTAVCVLGAQVGVGPCGGWKAWDGQQSSWSQQAVPGKGN